mmetsp:Transcript_14728/g.27286  ORF Transcript_14728/g.27286 Transcript_14728/m.27286 type:complete len:151 (+) Transcript_14728:1747-2199(+)
MELRHLAGRLLLISVFVFAGYNLLASPQTYATKLHKVSAALDPVLKAKLGVELPLEDIKLNSKIILQGAGALSLLGAVGTVRNSSLGIFLLVLLTLAASIAELPLLYTEPAQKNAHLLSLLKTLGVLGGLIILYTQSGAKEEDKKKTKND